MYPPELQSPKKPRFNRVNMSPWAATVVRRARARSGVRGPGSHPGRGFVGRGAPSAVTAITVSAQRPGGPGEGRSHPYGMGAREVSSTSWSLTSLMTVDTNLGSHAPRVRCGQGIQEGKCRNPKWRMSTWRRHSDEAGARGGVGEGNKIVNTMN